MEIFLFCWISVYILEIFGLQINERPAEHVATCSELQPGSGEKGSAAPEGDESFYIIFKIT